MMIFLCPDAATCLMKAGLNFNGSTALTSACLDSSDIQNRGRFVRRPSIALRSAADPAS